MKKSLKFARLIQCLGLLGKQSPFKWKTMKLRIVDVFDLKLKKKLI